MLEALPGPLAPHALSNQRVTRPQRHEGRVVARGSRGANPTIRTQLLGEENSKTSLAKGTNRVARPPAAPCQRPLVCIWYLAGQPAGRLPETSQNVQSARHNGSNCTKLPVLGSL